MPLGPASTYTTWQIAPHGESNSPLKWVPHLLIKHGKCKHLLASCDSNWFLHSTSWFLLFSAFGVFLDTNTAYTNMPTFWPVGSMSFGRTSVYISGSHIGHAPEPSVIRRALSLCLPFNWATLQTPWMRNSHVGLLIFTKKRHTVNTLSLETQERSQ